MTLLANLEEFVHDHRPHGNRARPHGSSSEHFECWGVMPSGMLRHPLFAESDLI
jgi:hypothetical protein